MLLSQSDAALPRADLCAMMPPCVLDPFLAAFPSHDPAKQTFLEADKMPLPNLELPASKAMR